MKIGCNLKPELEHCSELFKGKETQEASDEKQFHGGKGELMAGDPGGTGRSRSSTCRAGRRSGWALRGHMRTPPTVGNSGDTLFCAEFPPLTL